MASLSNFYSAPAGNVSQRLADYSLEGSDRATDTGLQQSRLMRDYSERYLPELVGGHAARGTFYGGQVGVQADRLKQDVGDQYGDLQRNLQRQLADLRRRGILAATGVVL